MDMSGERLIAAPRTKVWEALNDPEILKQCITGCDEISKESDTDMTASVTAKVGPVKARFKGKVTLSDIDPPNGYTISGEGQGGVAGFAKGGAKVQLRDQDGGTLLSYTVNAQVGGKLAQIGARLIDATATKYADEFFEKFSEIVGAAAYEQNQPGPAEASPASVTVSATAAASPSSAHAIGATPSASPSGSGIPSWLWIVALVVCAGLLLAYFGRG